MTADEADALFLSGIPGPVCELGLGTVVAAARLKVLAALPTELRGRASRLLERFHLDAAGWFQAGEEVPHLAEVAEAVWEGRQIRVDYQRGDKGVERTLHPLGIVLKGGVWYLVAATEGQVRTYRISRIANLQLLDGPAERPERFDLGAFWAESSAAYERDAPRLDVVVRVRPDRYWWLSDAAGQQAMDSAEVLDVPDAEGWTHVRLRMEWPRRSGTASCGARSIGRDPRTARASRPRGAGRARAARALRRRPRPGAVRAGRGSLSSSRPASLRCSPAGAA